MLSEQLLTGFVAAATEYIDALRQIMAEGADAPAHKQELQQKFQILAGSAQMLNISDIAELASSEAEWLESLDDDTYLNDEEWSRIQESVETLEIQLEALNMDEPMPESNGKSSPAPRHELPEIPPELLEIFTVEASEHNEAIQTQMVQLSQNPADLESLREIRRATHTLKGAAAAVGFDQIMHLAHTMEEMMETTLEEDRPLSSSEMHLLSDSADVLGNLITFDSAQVDDTLMQSVNDRFVAFLGEDNQPLSANPIAPPQSENVPTGQQRPEGVLRVPLDDVNELLNQVGDIGINRASLEEYVAELREMLGELSYSRGRIRSTAQDIDQKIEITVQDQRLDGQDDASFDPLELDRYTHLYQLTRELEEAVADTESVSKDLQNLTGQLDTTLTRERRLTTSLQDDITSIRLVPFYELETRLRRTVQRTARDVGKEVNLHLLGTETRIDKAILNSLADPLMHLLRNAIDHGIESNEARHAQGKPTTSNLTVSAKRERGRVIISLTDDGAGIDFVHLRERALQKGLIPEQDELDQEQLRSLLYTNGFSLAETVTETSG